ncbi:MAG TPA: hypothetical protein VFA33_06110 [Bryobacteraceae bacterium]|nr:hypothetical protein [Bryobacteraceae bacterium]
MRSSIWLYTLMLAIALVANQWMSEYGWSLGARVSACTTIGIGVAIVWRWFERRARRRRL